MQPAANTQPAADTPAPAATEPEGERQASARRIQQLAERYDFYAEPERLTKLKLSQPLLAYSNPVRGDVQGNVFAWTLDGQPQVIGAIFDFRSESKLDTELHLLSSPATVCSRDGKVFWSPERAGTTFQPLAGSPPPAKAAEGRLRSMVATWPGSSASWTAIIRNKAGAKFALLPQPIYRYAAESAGRGGWGHFRLRRRDRSRGLPDPGSC